MTFTIYFDNIGAWIWFNSPSDVALGAARDARDDGQAAGAWIDASARRGRFVHHYGAFRLANIGWVGSQTGYKGAGEDPATGIYDNYEEFRRLGGAKRLHRARVDIAVRAGDGHAGRVHEGEVPGVEHPMQVSCGQIARYPLSMKSRYQESIEFGLVDHGRRANRGERFGGEQHTCRGHRNDRANALVLQRRQGRGRGHW